MTGGSALVGWSIRHRPSAVARMRPMGLECSAGSITARDHQSAVVQSWRHCERGGPTTSLADHVLSTLSVRMSASATRTFAATSAADATGGLLSSCTACPVSYTHLTL